MSEWGHRFPEKTKWNDDPYFEMLLEIEKEAEGKILDVGCGRGEAVYFFNKKGLDCRGVDIKGCELWKRHNLNCSVYDGKTFPFKDSSFDTVLLNYVFEHIKDKKDFSDEIKRVLKQGGRAIFLLPTPKIKYSFWLNIPKYIVSLFKGHGFHFTYWFVHEPKVYGINIFAEMRDWGRWHKIMPQWFKIVSEKKLRNGKSIMIVCERP